jgi:Zn-dependent protease
LNGIIQWLRQLQFGSLLDMIVIVAASLLCITVHETCHGLAAYWMGDDTAKRLGRLSLNPMHHVDMMGLVMMALVRFGWAKPVPIDMRRFRNPKLGMALTALAGPVSNVLLMILAMLLRSVIFVPYLMTNHSVWRYGVLFLEYVAVLSAGLAVFNLFPVPPLDGSKVLFAVLPDRYYDKLMLVERYGMILLALLLIGGILDQPLMFLRGKLLDVAEQITEPVFYFLLARI